MRQAKVLNKRRRFIGKIPSPGEDDDRSYGNFWQRAKRRLRLARRSCSHENTSLHFRAAALPRHLGLLRHAFSHSGADAKTETAFETDRAGKAFTESFPPSFPKARP